MTRYKLAAACLLIMPILSMAQETRDLTLSEALRIAVERNLEVQLQRITVEKTALSFDQTKANYEPNLTSNFGYGVQDSTVTSTTQGNIGGSYSSTTSYLNSTMSKAEDFGLSYEVQFNNNFRDSDARDAFKQYSSTITFGVEQKLLQGFGKFRPDEEVYRKDQYVARGNLQLSKLDLENQLLVVIQTAENAYWDLVAALEQLDVRKSSLKLNQQLYDQNKVKVEVGTLAPIELAQNEADIASSEADLVSAENAVRAAEDRLKKVMNLPVEEWNQTLVPRVKLLADPIPLDFDTAVEIAMKKRIELQKETVQQRNAMLEYKTAKNQLLPNLSANAGYSSRGSSPQVDIVDNEPVFSSPSFTEGVEHAFANDLPGWQLGLTFSWKPFNQVGKINLAKAQATLRERELINNQQRINIYEEIRGAIRELEANHETIKARKKEVEQREANLKAELLKFRNGLVTNFNVAQIEDQLTQAKLRLLQAQVNYRKSIVAYYKATGELLEERGISAP